MKQNSKDALQVILWVAAGAGAIALFIYWPDIVRMFAYKGEVS